MAGWRNNSSVTIKTNIPTSEKFNKCMNVALAGMQDRVMTNNGGFLTPETQPTWRFRILVMSPRPTCHQRDDEDALH
jgi:hypothetical protein